MMENCFGQIYNSKQFKYINPGLSFRERSFNGTQRGTGREFKL